MESEKDKSFSFTKEKIRTIRLALGLSQVEAAKRAGIASSTWRNIELGLREMNSQIFELFLLKHRLLDLDAVAFISNQDKEKVVELLRLAREQAEAT